MAFESDVFQQVKEMDEMEAKKTLALIFSKYMKINKNGYTKEQCFNDVEQIYSEFILKDLFE